MMITTLRCGLLLLFCLRNASLATETPRRPNIIIVLADDMGYSDLGCYGGEIDTPNIDKLAQNGLRFTQFYNSGRCCPTRASLMTGLHPHQTGIGHMTEPPEGPLGIAGAYQGFMNDNCVTIAQVLQSAGYHTLMTGKWHLGLHRQSCWPRQRGFDKYFGGLSGAFNYFRPGGSRGLTRDNEPVEVPDEFYTTDAFTDEACRYISEVTTQDNEPFFLYLAYNAPHWPLNAKWEDYLKYRDTYRDGWEGVMDRRFAKQKVLGMWPDDTERAPHVGPEWKSLKPRQQTNLAARMAAYAGCIDSLDQNIGKLVSHLKSLDQWDNTVLIFLSDNGACQEGGQFGAGNEQMVKNPPLETVDGVRIGLAWANAANTPFRLYKHYVHEGGACTPFIVSWPQRIDPSENGSFVHQHGYLPDLMATCVELSGAIYPSEMPPCEGKSLVPLLEGSREPVHTEAIFWEHEGNAAVRWGDWKLVREYQKPWELYNLAQDRTELNDLAENESQRRDEMITLWETWATKHGVAFPQRFNMYEFLRSKQTPEN